MESVETLNERLFRIHGKHESGHANYRIVFSETEFERQWIEDLKTHADVPKYRQHIHNKYILERLIIIPEANRKQLLDKYYSYEPLWVFEDNHGNPLPPKWEACEMIIDTVLRAAARAIGVVYKDPESIPEEAVEFKKKQIDALKEDLFGDESDLTDALHYKEGVALGDRSSEILTTGDDKPLNEVTKETVH